MSSIGDVSTCFEDALPAAVTALCASENYIAAAHGTSINVYEMSRAASGISPPAFQICLTLSTCAPTTCMRVVGEACLASTDGSNLIYIWPLRHWHLPAAGSFPASVTVAGCCAAVLSGHDDSVSCLSFSAGRMFSSSADATICCWSTREFECSLRMKSNLGITALCCSEKALCSSDASNIVKVWNASSGDCLKEISVGRQIGGLSCNSGTLFVSVSRQICIPFSLSNFSAEQQFTLPTPAEDESPLTHMSSFGSIVTALASGRVVVLTAGGHMEQLHLDRIPATCHDTAGGFIVISHAQKNSVCVFHIEPFLAELTTQLQQPQNQYLENVRAADSKIATANKNLDLQVTLTGSSRICSVVNISGRFFIGHADGCLQCFQTFSSGVAKRIFSCQAHEDVVACSAILQLKAADTIATGSGDGCVKLWGQTDGQLLGEIEIGVGVRSMCIHQGSAMIGLEDGTVLHVEVDMKFRLKIVGEMRGHVADIIALQSDSKHIISSSSDSTVRVWVPTQRRCIQVLEPFPCIVTSLNWHNSMLFLGGQMGQLAAYSTTTWEVVSAIDEAHTQSITLLHMFKGSFIITGTVDGRVSIWNFEFEEAFSSAFCMSQDLGQVLKDSILHAELIKGKGAPQLWLVGASSQIVCLSSGELTSIMLRAEGGGQKPDVTSFFDGFISLLPVASSPLNSGLRQHDTKGVNVRNSSAADLNTLQQHSATAARSLSSASAAAAGQPSSYEPDIKQLKHVLDSINTTKTMAKIALTQQERTWRKAFEFFDENKDGTISASELGKLLVLLHRNTSASSLAALMKKFDLNQNNKMDFAEFVLLMQSLPETDEAIVERAISAQGASHSTHSKSIEVHSALASVNTQVPLLSISVSQSTVLAGAQCGLIYIWDLEASTSLHRHHTTSSHHVITPRCRSHHKLQEDCLNHIGEVGPGQQTHVAFVNPVQFVSGSSEGIICLWNATSRVPIYIYQLPGPVSCLVSWKNLLFAAGGSSDVLVFDWRTFQALSVLRGHLDIVHLAERIRSKHLLATASLDKTLRLWSMPTFCCVKTLEFDGCIVSMSVSEDKNILSVFALFDDNVVRRINIENGQTLIRWQLNHEISPAFILVLNESIFVAWRDSEVMELMTESGKKLSKCVGLYGAPEAITSAAGVLYSCCNSGTICCWGSRYLGDSDPKFEIDDCTTWADVARLNADILSPTITMRFPITDFLHKRQQTKTDIEPMNLSDRLRRYLGASPKKDLSKSRPHPILPTRIKKAPELASSPQLMNDPMNMRSQIRRVWLGTGEELTSSDHSSGCNPSAHDETEQPEILKRPPKLLQAADFEPPLSASVPARARAFAVTSRPTEACDLSVIGTTSDHSCTVALQDVLNLSADSKVQSPTTGAGKFFVRAKEYLRSRQPLSTQNLDHQQQHQNRFSQHHGSPLLQGNVLHPSEIVAKRPHASSSWSTRPMMSSKKLDHEQNHQNTVPWYPKTLLGESSVVHPDESVVDWSHVSNAWGAKSKRDTKKLFEFNPK